MRILVHEFASGGGFAGRPVPASLACEGAAIRAGLIADLTALGCHRIVATADPRFPLTPGARVEVVPVAAGRPALSGDLIASVDAVWLVAPEIDRCLERLAATVERRRTRLLGPGAAAIERASDKASLSRRLLRCGVPHPATRVLRRDADAARAARTLGYPVVVKPARGAGCIGVSLARDARELDEAIAIARHRAPGPLLLQRYVPGVAASVSLLCNGRRAVALSVNAQAVRPSPRFSYRGGRTPIAHPLASRAVDVALHTCRALPGLRGYIGVDVVLTESEAIVIEVNPRLTTAYLGVRAALNSGNGGLGANLAGMVIATCEGQLPASPPLLRRVRFTSAGRITSLR